MKRLLQLGMALILAFGATALGIAASDQPKRGGTLTMAIGKDLTVMNPLTRTRSTDKLIRELIYESLVDLDEKGEIVPKLAESWEVSRDGKVFTFRLRKGVKYHDGREMTAADAKFAIDYTLNPKNAAYGRQRIIIVERAEAVDKNTLRVYLKAPSASFLAVVADIMSFSVIPQGSLEEGAGKVTSFPPGTGPFKFVEWVPAQKIVFDRFDDYWGQKVYLDRVVLKPIPDDTIRFTALRSGDVDIVERTPYQWVRQLLDGKIPGIEATEALYADFRRLYFNVADPPFNNPKLRQAVAHAINKEELLKAAYFGFGKPDNQNYPKGHVWHVEGLPTATYNPARARELLKEAGYKGETIDMKVEQGQVVETMATTLQSQLKKIGMNVKVLTMEYGARREQIHKGDTTIDFTGGDFYADPATTYRNDLSCEPNPKIRTNNPTGYCNKERDAMVDQLETEFNPQKRKDLLKQILTNDAKTIAIMAIGFTPRFYTYRSHVKGFTTDDNGAYVWSGGGLTRTWIDK